ncbi:helix-turn-helix domain-containing protein [Domibacillus enclensis]|uniref:Uncharacterized protein YpbB n=1 Tax=Domibacillus enclensis TaxID=1017273 RepID=A0A1N6PB36_9BACI|nr:helix-turn-helix domain-containing protein [Domibacillus enclensis]OXS80302.1 hypothetical protein B1B05_02165 [Domibacillus enclensis]SIQ01544.1 Uncharacterized protein YpbB [Domibacillus enclensis]
MRCLDAVILLMLKEVEGERTASSVYHLLKGKKSAQTIQDAHLYELQKWFQTAPFLQMHSFEQAVQHLLDSGHLHGTLQRLFLTEKGLKAMENKLNETTVFPFLSGWTLSGTAPVFFNRIQLLVQVVSHIAYSDRSYYPVTRDEHVQEWMKGFLKKSSIDKTMLSAQLQKELIFVLERQPENPDCILLRFSGRGQTALTAEQAAEWLLIEPTEYWYRFLHSLHAIIQLLLTTEEEMPLLKHILSDITVTVPLTASARKTAEYLQNNLTIDQIVSVRHLKRSTVEDHIVELALNDPHFSIRPFITEEKEQAVLQAGASKSTRQLKPLKDQLPDHTYFEIRLVLAKESRRSE